MLVQLAIAGAVLAHSLLALEARLVVVFRLEGLQTHPAGSGPSSWLLFGRRPASTAARCRRAAAAAVVIVVIQTAAVVLLLLLLLLALIAGRAVTAAGIRIRRHQRGAWRHFINWKRDRGKADGLCNQLLRQPSNQPANAAPCPMETC